MPLYMIWGLKQWHSRKYQRMCFSLFKISQAEITMVFNSQDHQRYPLKELSTGRCVLFKYFVWILYVNFLITLILFILVPFYSTCAVKVLLPKTSMILEQHCKIFRYAILLLLYIKTDSRKCRVFSTYVALAPWQIDLKKNFPYCHKANEHYYC